MPEARHGARGISYLSEPGGLRLVAATVTLPLVYTNGAGPTTATTDTETDLANRKIDMLLPRIGPSIRRLLKMAAAFDDGYTTDELATKLGMSKVQLRSLAGNLGRSMRRVDAAVGDEPPIYRWDDAKGKYVMPDAVRQAILSKI